METIVVQSSSLEVFLGNYLRDPTKLSRPFLGPGKPGRKTNNNAMQRRKLRQAILALVAGPVKNPAVDWCGTCAKQNQDQTVQL